MTSRFFHIFWLTLALLCGTVLADDEIRWAPDIAQARQASAQFKVPLLIHFYGDNCLPCKTLEQRVLSQSEVVQALNKYFICVRVNATQNRRVAAEFQVHSWPTDVFVSPDGKTLYQGVCQQDVRSYVGVLENVAVMNRDRNIMLAAAKEAQPNDTIAQQTAPVGNGTMMEPQLPPPGANRLTSSQTPSFYTGASDAGAPAAGTQHLQASTSPMAGVQSGPLLQNSQPASITGSTLASQQQLAAPTKPDFNTAENGKLPPRTATVAQIRAAADQQGGLAALPEIPSLEAPAAAAVATNKQFVSLQQAGETVTNPYFPQPQAQTQPLAQTQPQAQTQPLAQSQPQAQTQPQAHVPTQSALAANASPSLVLDGPELDVPTGNIEPRAQASIPAQTVSFQPRASAETTSSKVDPAKTDSVSATVEATPAKPAIGGYCPVALIANAEWIEGDPRWAVKHRGKIYWLSSQAARQKFLNAPDASSPVLSGFDPMIFLNEGRLVEGDIENGLHEEVGGSILFFASEESKKQYEKDYDRNTRALSVIIKQAGGQ